MPKATSRAPVAQPVTAPFEDEPTNGAQAGPAPNPNPAPPPMPQPPAPPSPPPAPPRPAPQPAMAQPPAPPVPTQPTVPPGVPSPAPALPQMGALVSQPQSPVDSAMATMMGAGQGGAGFLGQLDLGNVQESNFRLLDPNVEYEFEIDDAKIGTSQTNQPKLVVEMHVTFPVRDRGVRITDHIPLGGDNPWKFKSLCRACGLLSEDGKRFIGTGPADFKEYIVRNRIKHDTWVGQDEQVRTSNKIATGYSEGYESPEIAGNGAENNQAAPNWAQPR